MNEEMKTYVEGKREPHIVIEMPMPENCRECPLMASVDDYSYFCAPTKKKIGNWFEEWIPFSEAPYSTERRPDCPLKEVKDPWLDLQKKLERWMAEKKIKFYTVDDEYLDTDDITRGMEG